MANCLIITRRITFGRLKNKAGVNNIIHRPGSYNINFRGDFFIYILHHYLPISMLSIAHQVFLEVAANLSFSKAAQVLFITQPAVSKHIKLLEDQYKVPLFERKGPSILL